MRGPRAARTAVVIAAVGLGAVVALAVGTAASAYGPSPTVPPVTPTTTASTTTTVPSSTTTTVPSSTTTTAPNSTTTSIGASPGTTIASGSANSQPVGLTSNTTSPGGSVGVSFSSSFSSVAGARATTTPAPCNAGVSVSIDLLLLQDGQSPVNLTTATSNASGGLSPVTVTIPTSAVTGTYVFFAQCNNAAGILEILTSPLVLVTTGSGHVAYAPRDFTVAKSYGTPAQRTALEDAVRSQIARGAGASSHSTNGGIQLAFARTGTGSDPPGSSRALSYGLTAAVLVLMAAGLVTLRRRRSLPTS